MKEWVAAFGGHVKLTAPKHYHGVFEVDKQLDTPYGTWEYMCYEFVIRSATYLNRDDLLAAFKAESSKAQNSNDEGFRFIDRIVNDEKIQGPPVPVENWDAWLKLWIPEDQKGEIKSNPNPGREFRYNFGAPIGPRTTISAETTFRVDPPKISEFVWRINNPGVIPPEGDEDRQTTLKEKLKENLLKDPDRPFESDPSRFDVGHRFPVFTRLGYKSLDDFIKGHTWRFSVTGKSTKTLVCHGTRAVYTIVMPITAPDPATVPTESKLIVNFFPNSSSLQRESIIHLAEDDDRFFATEPF